MGCPVVVAWWPTRVYALPLESGPTLLIVGVSDETLMPIVRGVDAGTAALNVPVVLVTEPPEFLVRTTVGAVNAT